MVTGLMWRFLEKEGHVSELSPVYQQQYSAFKRLSTDAHMMILSMALVVVRGITLIKLSNSANIISGSMNERDRCGRDSMVVRFTTTYVIITYHQ
jgi:hypothetical protein